MQVKLKKSIPFLLLLYLGACSSEKTHYKTEEVVYKEIDSVQLKMKVVYPFPPDSTTRLPAIVFFFGGGWQIGNTDQFANHAKYFAQRGAVSFLVEYRIESKHGTTPFESLEDAKSAIRFVRKNNKRFFIHPDKIVAAGSSAGGHLAAATALISGYNNATDDLSVSPSPNALVLFNPVIDNGPTGYGYERIGENYKEFSPLHNVRKKTPPMIIFQGTNDRYVPESTIRRFQKLVQHSGSRCVLHLYPNQDHGFFNYDRNNHYFKETLHEADSFLTSLSLLHPSVKNPG